MNLTLEEVSLREVAARLAHEAVNAEPGLRKIYLFPSETEIRLIEVDPLAPPVHEGGRIAPFYFGASKAADIPFRSAVALVRPEEDGNAPLPVGWGDWADADVIWETRK